MSDRLDSRVAAFCQHIGAKHAWEYTSGGHRRLSVTHNGRRAIAIVSATPGDRKVAETTIRDIRHGLGLVGGKRVGQRRERKNSAAERLPPIPTLTMKEDRFTPALAVIAERLQQQQQMEETMQTIQTPIASPKPRGEPLAPRIRNLLLSGASVKAVMDATGASMTNVHNQRSLLMREGRLQSLVPSIRREHARVRREASKAAAAAMESATGIEAAIAVMPRAPKLPPAHMLPQPLLRWPAVAAFSAGVGVAVATWASHAVGLL